MNLPLHRLRKYHFSGQRKVTAYVLDKIVFSFLIIIADLKRSEQMYKITSKLYQIPFMDIPFPTSLSWKCGIL